jgi:hypothetical protein
MTKQIIIKVKIEGKRFGTIIKHRGFDVEGADYVLEVVGALEHLKSQMLNKLENKKND